MKLSIHKKSNRLSYWLVNKKISVCKTLSGMRQNGNFPILKINVFFSLTLFGFFSSQFFLYTLTFYPIVPIRRNMEWIILCILISLPMKKWINKKESLSTHYIWISAIILILSFIYTTCYVMLHLCVLKWQVKYLFYLLNIEWVSTFSVIILSSYMRFMNLEFWFFIFICYHDIHRWSNS